MDSIAIPLRVKPTGIDKEKNLKKSIDTFIDLLLTTPKFDTPADSEFGFVLNNLRFEIFNEREGVVYDSNEKGSVYGFQGLYDKKISGSSKNLNTYASELKTAVERYELRLKDVSTSMTYMRSERKIYITVKGVITDTEKEYVYTNILKIWN